MKLGDENFRGLLSQRLHIRRIKSDDLSYFLAYHQDPLVQRYLGEQQHFSSKQEAIALIDRMQNLSPDISGEKVFLAITKHATTTLIGDCSVLTDPLDHRQVEISITLASAHQRQGYAREALMSLCDYFFLRREKNKVKALSDTRHHAYISLLEKIGMQREARFRESRRLQEQWYDEYLYAVLQRDWIKKSGFLKVTKS